MGTIPLADDATVEVDASADVTAMQLSQDEGFLVSRILGRRTTVGELVNISGMAPEQTRATLARLAIKGALHIESFGSSQLDGEPVVEDDQADDPYKGMIFSLGDLNEKGDLSKDQRKRILFVETKLEEWSHYALLGLKRTATQGEIKRAYFKASKEFHPDAYFRKELGSFKGRIDKIFRRMKGAYDVLNDPEKRAEYDQTLPADFTPAEQEELRRLAEQHRAEAEERARKERLHERKKARRKQRNPMVERIAKARQLMQLAESAQREGKTADAARHAKLALEYARKDPQVSAAAQRIIEDANVDRARAMLRRVPALLSGLDTEEMLEAAEELAELGAKDGKVLSAAAELFLEGGRPQRGLKFAQQATGLAPSHEEGWSVLYRLAAKTNSWNTAFRAAERLRELDGKNAQYKDWLKLAKRQR